MTVYINGFKASKADLAYLQQQLNKGQANIISISKTKAGSIAIRTI